jgi:hypothetical protein
MDIADLKKWAADGLPLIGEGDTAASFLMRSNEEVAANQ